jgi:WD40 repeat protein
VNTSLWSMSGLAAALFFLAGAAEAEPAGPAPVQMLAHTGNVMALTYQPGGPLLASGDDSGRVLLWDAASGRLVRQLLEPSDQFLQLAFSPTGKYLAAFSMGGIQRQQGGKLRVWEVEKSQLKLDLTLKSGGFACLAFSPDGMLLAAVSDRSSEEKPALRFWDTAAWKEQPRVSLPTAPNCLAFAPDGKRLLGGFQEKLVAWKVPGGEQILEEKTILGAHAIAFQPNGKLLATAGGFLLQLRDLEGGQPETVKVEGAPGPFAFSPDGRSLAIMAVGLHLLDVRTRTVSRVLLEKQYLRGAVAFSPDGKRLAVTVGADIRLFDPATGEEKLLIGGQHLGPVGALAWAEGGRHFVVGGFDHRVKLWDAQTGGVLANFLLPNEVIRVAVSASGERLAAMTRNDGKGVLKAWETGTGRELLSFPLIVNSFQGDLTISPDGKRLALSGEETLVWQLGKSSDPVKLPGGGMAAFSPDGRLLAAVKNTLVEEKGATGPGKMVSRAVVHIWELESGKERFSPVTLESSGICSLGFSADNARLEAVFMGEKPEIQLLNAQTGERLPRVPLRDFDLFGATMIARALSGTRLAVVSDQGRRLRVFDARFGAFLQELIGPSAPRTMQPGNEDEIVTGVTFSPDGRSLLVASAPRGQGTSRLRVHPIRESHLTFVHEISPGPVAALAVGPEWERFAAAGQDGRVRLQTLAVSGEPAVVATLAGPVVGMCFTADGKKLYCAGGPTGRAGGLQSVALPSGKPVPLGIFFQGPVQALGMAPDGGLLAVSGDKSVLVVETATDRASRRLVHEHAVLALAFHPDNRQLACASFGSIWLWDAKEGKALFSVSMPALPVAVAFSPDGKLLAAAGSDGIIRVWELQTRKEKARLEGPIGRPRCLAWHPGGKLLVSGGGELDQAANVIFWGVATGRRLLEFNGHHGPVRGLAFHPDGRLLTAGWDGTVKVWQEPTAQLTREEPELELATRWRLDGKELVLNKWDGPALFIGDPKWTDYTVEVEGMATDGPGELNVLVRADGMDQNTRVILGGWGNRFHGFLVAQPGAKTLDLLPLSGQPGTAVQGQTERSRWYAIRVEVRGKTVEVFLDGKRLMKTEQVPQKQGNVGLHGIGTAARFRKLKVTGPDGKLLLEKLPPLSP